MTRHPAGVRRALIALVLVACASIVAAAPKLHDLRQVDDLKAAFNRDARKTRIVLLVSPT